MEEPNSQQQTVFTSNIIASHILTTIFEEAEMSEQFGKANVALTDKSIEQKYQRKILQNNSKIVEQQKLQEKPNKSRLQIQIKKNNFKMVAISGQLFLMMVQAQLQGRSHQKKGKLMMTNYRIVFFSESKKMVDMPFGLILNVNYSDRLFRVNYNLKYPHTWTFFIASSAFNYQYFKNICSIYYKSDHIKNLFAFQYALKLPPSPSQFAFDLKQEYSKYLFDQNKGQYLQLLNYNYTYCASYPSVVYIPKFHDLISISINRKNKRFPILAYSYLNPQTKLPVPIWIASAYEDSKQIIKQKQKQFLQKLKCNLNLRIFVAQSKQNKAIDQTYIQKDIQITYLNLQSNDNLLLAQRQLMEVFLQSKKPFIKQILNSKWYYFISNLLESCQIIRNNVLNENATLIRCENGWDKSLVLAALVQVILDSSFRTFRGFSALVMRMFVSYGYPFASRLGERAQGELMCPLFLQFLDCVSQLIYQNPSHFQFNFKYLSKIANLMFTNIYGTFIADNERQYKQQKIAQETVSIWDDLISPITTNGFYDKKFGLLDVQSNISSIRLWKEHFAALVSRNTDHYCFVQVAQDNEDYLNLNCQQVKQENKDLKKLLKQMQAELDRLKHQLAEA